MNTNILLYKVLPVCALSYLLMLSPHDVDYLFVLISLASLKFLFVHVLRFVEVLLTSFDFSVNNLN